MQREVSKSEDGVLHFGQTVLLANKLTEGVLSFNPNDKIIGEDAFAVTTSRSEDGPALRNVFAVEHLTNPESKEVVKYGDKFRLVAVLPNNIKVRVKATVVVPAELAIEPSTWIQDQPKPISFGIRSKDIQHNLAIR